MNGDLQNPQPAPARQPDLDPVRNETYDVLGGRAYDMALDSAPKLYAKALQAMGVRPNGVHSADGIRDLFRSHRARLRAAGMPLRAPDPEAARRFAERHPKLARMMRVS